ncbi:hypothetical protein [Glutamicibacter arilaitensis]|uniref:hypothetical protein n=1 Tax=Glutamicibacter arilaitensis TaxID=256701 RepID=UPI003F908FD3
MSDRTGLVTARPKVDVIMARDWMRDPSTGRWVNSGPWNGWAIYYNGQLIADVDKCQLNEAMTYARVVAKSETEPELSDLDSGGYWVLDAEELDEWYEEFVENLSA